MTIFRGPEFLETSKLDVKVFFKSTDTHALLHKHSLHPSHTFKGIIKAQLLRFQRICMRCECFLEALIERGYTRAFLKFHFRNFQERKDKINDKQIPLITTFSSMSSNLNRTWKCNFKTIFKSKKIVPNLGTVSANRRNNNLKDWLVRAKLPTLDWKKPPAQQKNFSKLDFIRSNSNQLIKIRGEFDLKSVNLLFVIICATCNQKYVGETKNNLSK